MCGAEKRRARPRSGILSLMRPGTLYLVATPVGNLEDITLRALEILKTADIVTAEDTRHTKILLSRHGVEPRRLISFHSHNVEKRVPELLRELQSGKSVAVVTDAGAPGISDPGVVLVKAAVENGVDVCPIPGATAPILAVTASGFPSHRFVFEGFPPRKKGRRKMIESWKNEERTVVFFESPQRIVTTLKNIRDIIGERKVCVARELTKKFEEFIRGDIGEVINNLEKRGSVKGEITVVMAPEGY